LVYSYWCYCLTFDLHTSVFQIINIDIPNKILIIQYCSIPTKNKTHECHNKGVKTCAFSFFQCLHVHRHVNEVYAVFFIANRQNTREYTFFLLMKLYVNMLSYFRSGCRTFLIMTWSTLYECVLDLTDERKARNIIPIYIHKWSVEFVCLFFGVFKMNKSDWLSEKYQLVIIDVDYSWERICASLMQSLKQIRADPV